MTKKRTKPLLKKEFDRFVQAVREKTGVYVYASNYGPFSIRNGLVDFRLRFSDADYLELTELEAVISLIGMPRDTISLSAVTHGCCGTREEYIEMSICGADPDRIKMVAGDI